MIKKILDKVLHKKMEEKLIDRRLQRRYYLCSPKIGSIRVDGISGSFPLLDFSGGGMRVTHSPDLGKHVEIGKEVKNVSLFLLGYQVKVDLKCLHMSNSFIGFKIIPTDSSSRMLMIEIIENLHMGSSLRKVNPDLLIDKYKAGNWDHFRGKGPTDLKIGFTDRNNSVTFYLRYINGTTYDNCEYINSTLLTSKSIDDQPFREKFELVDQARDQEILLRSAIITLGFANTKTGKEVGEAIIYIFLADLSKN